MKLIRVFDKAATQKFGSQEAARYLWDVIKRIPSVKNYIKQNHYFFRECSEIYQFIKNVFLKNERVILDQAAGNIMNYTDKGRGKHVKQVCILYFILYAVLHDMIRYNLFYAQGVSQLELNVSNIIELLQRYKELYKIVNLSNVQYHQILIEQPVLSLKSSDSTTTKRKISELITFAVENTVDGQLCSVQYEGVFWILTHELGRTKIGDRVQSYRNIFAKYSRKDPITSHQDGIGKCLDYVFREITAQCTLWTQMFQAERRMFSNISAVYIFLIYIHYILNKIILFYKFYIYIYLILM